MNKLKLFINLGVSLHSATILPTMSISRCWLSIFRQLIPYSGHLNSWKSPKHDIRTSKCVWLLSLTEQTDLHLIPLSRLCVKSKPIIRPKGRIRERNIVPSHLSILHFCAAHSIHICIPSLPCQDGNISPTKLHTERNFSQGLAAESKAKKIQEGIVGFGCNFGGMIAHLYRSHSPGYTQIRQG